MLGNNFEIRALNLPASNQGNSTWPLSGLKLVSFNHSIALIGWFRRVRIPIFDYHCSEIKTNFSKVMSIEPSGRWEKLNVGQHLCIICIMPSWTLTVQQEGGKSHIIYTLYGSTNQNSVHSTNKAGMMPPKVRNKVLFNMIISLNKRWYPITSSYLFL